MSILTRVIPAALLVLSLQIPTPNPKPQAPATAVVAGQVVDAVTGRGIGGAVVTLLTGGAPPAAASSVSPAAPARRSVAVANAEGRFVFRDVPAGTYALTSTLDGYTPGSTGKRRPTGPGRGFTVADGARITDARIQMWRLSTISGYVRDDRGEPAIGVYMWAMRRVLNNGRWELTFAGGGGEATDERGYYRISNLMPGSYVIAIRTTTQTMAATSADAYREAVTAGTTANFSNTFRATGAVQVSGRGISVGEWIVSTLSDAPRVLPGPNGTLLMPPPLVYYPSARTAPEATVITLGSGDDRAGIDVTMPLVPAVRVSGVLMGPEGPAANHGVRLIPAIEGEPAYENPVAYGVTDASGRFAIIGATPGNYMLRSHRVTPTGPGAMRFDPPAAGTLPISPVTQTQPTTLSPSLFAELPVTIGNAHVDNLSLMLQPGARVSGHVVLDDVAPAAVDAKPPRIIVSLRPLGNTLPIPADAPVDANGQFTFMGFPPGRYAFTLMVVAPTAPLTIASIQAGGTDVTTQPLAIGTTDVSDVVVALTNKGPAISGTVRTGDAKVDVDGCTIVLFPVDVQTWIKTGMSPRRTATATASASGTYRLTALPGDYFLVAVPAEIEVEVSPDFVKRFSGSAVRISIAPGESKVQDLTLARAK